MVPAPATRKDRVDGMGLELHLRSYLLLSSSINLGQMVRGRRMSIGVNSSWKNEQDTNVEQSRRYDTNSSRRHVGISNSVDRNPCLAGWCGDYGRP